MIRHLIAILTLPAAVGIGVPLLIIHLTGLPVLTWSALDWVCVCLGTVSAGLGMALMVATNTMFATLGKGTLAPWDPPTNLVVEGVYKHVRNPMITGLLCVMIGEALCLQSPLIASWTFIFRVANLLWLPLVEEPKLAKRFGDSYLEYKRNVPRWIPRLKPWSQPDNVNR